MDPFFLPPRIDVPTPPHRLQLILRGDRRLAQILVAERVLQRHKGTIGMLERGGADPT